MTWRSILATVFALLASIPLVAGEAAAQHRDRDRDRGPDAADRGGPPGPREQWDLLGEQKVGFGVDHDTIRVGRREGRYQKIALEVRDNDVEFLSLKVFFMHGPPQDVEVRQFIRAGGRTRPIDLIGGDRAIDRIDLVYKSRPSFRGQASVTVYGLQGGPPPGPPPRADWELLGEQKVGFGVDHDTIRVGRREGRFQKIALEVRDNDVEILSLKVFFLRGPPQDVEVRQFIRAGSRTRPIDLIGDDRAIDRIDLVYKSRPSFRGRASVAVYGLQGFGGPPHGPPPGPPPRAEWEELGCSKAGFLPDHDTIRVGRREGRFSAIKLAVSGNKVHILDLKVIYERGAPDDISVRSEIREGGETRPLDLRGERRAIQQVELYYLAQPNFKGSARVCILGRQ